MSIKVNQILKLSELNEITQGVFLATDGDNVGYISNDRALLSLGYIVINENLFEYKKSYSNTTSDIQEGDVAVNGWISSTNFVRVMSYVGGNPTEITSWNIIDNIEF